MRISDWSSDVCSSDLNPPPVRSQRILNIGDSHPVGLMEMISTLEKALGRTAEKIMRPMQPGDVTATYADVSKLHALTGYRPTVMLEDGLQRFAVWYRALYGTYDSRLRPRPESYAEDEHCRAQWRERGGQ